MAAILTGETDDLVETDKLSLIKSEFDLATKSQPNYSTIKKEINDYVVELPKLPKLNDLSGINKLYAITQCQRNSIV